MLELDNIYYGDCFEMIKELDDNSVDLIVTSPPYANATSYGKEVNVLHPDKYNDWIMPLMIEIGRVLKPTGSFIFNINDKIQNGFRSTYVFDLIHRVVNEKDEYGIKVTDLKLYDRYIWYKKSGLPTGGIKRLNDKMEYIFHFTKTKGHKSYTDRVRIPYADISLKRMKTEIGANDIIDENGITTTITKKVEPNELGKKPDGIFRFNTAGVLKGETAGTHPATYHYDLPYLFIEWLTDKGDVVLDPFLGTGTSTQVAKKMGRKYVGFELNDSYKEVIDLKMSDEEIDKVKFTDIDKIFRNIKENGD